MKIPILLLISSLVFASAVPSYSVPELDIPQHSGGVKEFGGNNEMAETWNAMAQSGHKLSEADLRHIAIAGGIFLAIGILYYFNQDF